MRDIDGMEKNQRWIYMYKMKQKKKEMIIIWFVRSARLSFNLTEYVELLNECL